MFSCMPNNTYPFFVVCMKALTSLALWRKTYAVSFKPVCNTHRALKRGVNGCQAFLNVKSIHTTQSFHMESEIQKLHVHLKEYYGVDVQVATDGRVEFPWTARNSDDILKQLLDRFSNLPNGSSG